VTATLRRLLWRLFPPPEVTATRSHIREFLRRVSPTYPLPRQLERHAVARTRDAPSVVKLINVEHRAVDEVALQFVSATVLSLLMSGRYHLDRGMLSGEGHALVSVFTRCMMELQQRGYQTEAASEAALREMRDAI
jgi:hypothetical protein